MTDNSILFQAVVIDNQDPMMLGRVRATLLNPPTEMGSQKDIVIPNASPIVSQGSGEWQSGDPLIFNPLIPYFLYQVPKKDELIQIIYLNKDYPLQNQYYIQSNFYSPTAVKFQYQVGGNKFTATGIAPQISPPKPLKNQDGTYTDSAVHKGVFPEPGDNGLLGRGSADVIVKENEILIRAGKFKGISLQPNIIPTGNSQRGF